MTNCIQKEITMPTTALLFESKLVCFCTPTLLKIKSGNIFNIDYNFNELNECLEYYNQICNKKGIYLDIIYESNKSKMIYVYQKEKIENLLTNQKIRNILNQYNYPLYTIDDILNWLKVRMNGNKFPHEIGLFLGYPLNDVHSFINGANHIYIGYWKVYSHLNSALNTFEKYNKCTQEIKRRFYQGERIIQILRNI